MKKLIYGAACAALLAFAHSANAVAINVLGTGDFPAKDIEDVTGNPGLGDQNVLDWLEAVADDHGFPAPTTFQTDYTGGAIKAGDFLVLHYGKGNGQDSTPGGGLVALYFDADQASYAVPADGAGPNGTGGISFARLFDHGDQVPDGGATLALLGLSLASVSIFSRRK